MLSDLFVIEDKKEHEIKSINFYNDEGVIESFEPYTEVGKPNIKVKTQKVNKFNPERKIVSYINLENKNGKFISDILVPSDKNCTLEYKGEVERNSTPIKKFIYKKYLLNFKGHKMTVLKLKESQLTELGEQIKTMQDNFEKNDIFLDEYTVEEILKKYNIEEKE